MRVIEAPEIVPIEIGQQFFCRGCKCCFEITKKDIDAANEREDEILTLRCPVCRFFHGIVRPENAAPRNLSKIFVGDEWTPSS